MFHHQFIYLLAFLPAVSSVWPVFNTGDVLVARVSNKTERQIQLKDLVVCNLKADDDQCTTLDYLTDRADEVTFYRDAAMTMVGYTLYITGGLDEDGNRISDVQIVDLAPEHGLKSNATSLVTPGSGMQRARARHTLTHVPSRDPTTGAVSDWLVACGGEAEASANSSLTCERIHTRRTALGWRLLNVQLAYDQNVTTAPRLLDHSATGFTNMLFLTGGRLSDDNETTPVQASNQTTVIVCRTKSFHQQPLVREEVDDRDKNDQQETVWSQGSAAKSVFGSKFGNTERNAKPTVYAAVSLSIGRHSHVSALYYPAEPSEDDPPKLVICGGRDGDGLVLHDCDVFNLTLSTSTGRAVVTGSDYIDSTCAGSPADGLLFVDTELLLYAQQNDDNATVSTCSCGAHSLLCQAAKILTLADEWPTTTDDDESDTEYVIIPLSSTPQGESAVQGTKSGKPALKDMLNDMKSLKTG